MKKICNLRINPAFLNDVFKLCVPLCGKDGFILFKFLLDFLYIRPQ